MRHTRRCSANLVIAVVGLLLCAEVQGTAAESGTDVHPSSQEEFRTWSDRSGNYHAEAVLIEIGSQAVTLKKKDGTTVHVPLGHLSDADRQYVGTFATGASGEDLAPSPGSEPNDSSARGGDAAAGDDESVRTEARGDASTQSRARVSCRTTARTTARAAVRSSNNRGARRVVVEGVGATAEEALTDCLRKAVSIVMGTIIDAQTEVDSDRLVLDRILTFTDGFVDTYEELEAAHVEGGLVHRRIAATVRRDSLLLACGKAESMSVDASGLYPEAMTRLERRSSARALLRRTLDVLPGSLLQVRLTGRPGIETLGEATTTLGPELVVRVDPQKFDSLQDRLVQILQCLSRQDGTVAAVAPLLPRAWQAQGREVLRGKFLGVAGRRPATMPIVDADFGPIRALIVKKIPALSSDASRLRGQEAGALVLVKRQSDWKWFELDKPMELPPRAATLAIAFRNGDGEEVKTATLAMGPWLPGLAAPPDNDARGAGRTVFISPSFLYYAGEGRRIPRILVARSMTVHGQVTLGNAQLSQVKTIDAKVVRVP
jgi:hypothetical protein